MTADILIPIGIAAILLAAVVAYVLYLAFNSECMGVSEEWKEIYAEDPKAMEDPDYHVEILICPTCKNRQPAKVLHTLPWWTFIHECTTCGHTIMEDEWKSSQASES